MLKHCVGMQHPGRQVAEHPWGVALSLKRPHKQQYSAGQSPRTMSAVWAPSAMAPPTWAHIQFWYRKAWRAKDPKDQLLSTIMLFMVTNMTQKG